MNWVAKIIVTILGILVCVMFILLGAHFFNDLFHVWPVHIDSIKPCDKFEVYRDLLIILLTTLGIVGYFGYRQLRTSSEEYLRKVVESHENQILARLYNRLSYSHFREYETIDPYYKKRGPRFNELLRLTIEEGESAISFCEKMDDKKQEGMVNLFRVDLAYHLAVRGDAEDKNRALALARENRDLAIKYAPAGEHDIRESVVWVILTYSDDMQERQEAENETKSFRRWKKIPEAWKAEIAKKYKKIFGIPL